MDCCEGRWSAEEGDGEDRVSVARVMMMGVREGMIDGCIDGYINM